MNNNKIFYSVVIRIDKKYYHEIFETEYEAYIWLRQTLIEKLLKKKKYIKKAKKVWIENIYGNSTYILKPNDERYDYMKNILYVDKYYHYLRKSFCIATDQLGKKLINDIIFETCLYSSDIAFFVHKKKISQVDYKTLEANLYQKCFSDDYKIT